MQIELAKTYFWTDFSTVLYYTRNKTKFRIFVASELAEIHEQSMSCQWVYIKREVKPRGLDVESCHLTRGFQSWFDRPRLVVNEAHWRTLPKMPDIEPEQIFRKICMTSEDTPVEHFPARYSDR